MNNYSEKIVILTGDPNGIGAEITIKALNLLNLPTKDLLIISNQKILNTYGSLNNNYSIINIDYEGKIEPGCVTAEAGDFSFRYSSTYATNSSFLSAKTSATLARTLAYSLFSFKKVNISENLKPI